MNLTRRKLLKNKRKEERQEKRRKEKYKIIIPTIFPMRKLEMI